MQSMITDTLLKAWYVTGEMAPYLLFGFLAAGILSVLISPSLVERHLGGNSLWSTVKAALFGIPLPLCSCGVIPVGASLRRHGASKGASAAFLLATPQTGVDSILATYALMGPVFGTFRPLAAIISGIACGWAVDTAAPDSSDTVTSGTGSDNDSKKQHTGPAWKRALRYGFRELPEDIGKPLLLGIAISGIIAAFIPDNFFADILTSNWISMLVMLVIGIPMYVCSTASIPIAFSLMAAGISPGAALVFLIAGPATNTATITTIYRVLGRKALFTYLASAMVTALLSGFALDAIYRLWNLPVPGGHIHEHTISTWQHIAAVVLMGILVYALVPRRIVQRHSALTIHVPDIRCHQCEKSIRSALLELDHIDEVTFDLAARQVYIKGQQPDPELIKDTISSLGYTPQDEYRSQL